MLENLLKTLSGTAATAAYSNPAVNGIRGVPLSATFGKVFNNLLSSFTPFGGITGNNIPQQGFLQQGFGGINPNAIQAYNNAQNVQPITTLKNQAFAPGAVLINSAGIATTQQAASPAAALGLLGGFAAPLQGFAGQSNINGQGNPQFPTQGPFQFFQPQQAQQQGGFGGLQLLLGPVIGLFTFVKSFFGLGGIRGSLNPVQIDKGNIGYTKYQDYITETYVPGSFDEPNTSYEGSGFAETYSEDSRYF